MMSREVPEEDLARFKNCINVPNRQTQKFLDEIEELKNENTRLKQENTNKDEAIKEMQEKMENLEKRDFIFSEEISFELHKWMKDEVTSLKLSFKKLMKHTMELYKRILDKESSKEKSTSAAERRRLANEGQKLEELCEKIDSETKKKNQESIHTIADYLRIPIDAAEDTGKESTDDTNVAVEWVSDEQRTLLEVKEEVQKIGKLCEEVTNKEIVKMAGLIPEIGKMCEQISRDMNARTEEKEEKKRQLLALLAQENKKLIQPFLGTFVFSHAIRPRTVEILYNEQTGYYEDKHTNPILPSLNRTSSWTLDGVKRDGVLASIEGNFLVVTDINYTPVEMKYELFENEIKCNGFSFLRRK